MSDSLIGLWRVERDELYTVRRDDDGRFSAASAFDPTFVVEPGWVVSRGVKLSDDPETDAAAFLPK